MLRPWACVLDLGTGVEGGVKAGVPMSLSTRLQSVLGRENFKMDSTWII